MSFGFTGIDYDFILLFDAGALVVLVLMLIKTYLK